MEYKFVIKVEADSEGEAEEKLSEWDLETIKDSLVCETEENLFILCDECQTSISETEYNLNKGLCNECIRNIN